MVLDGEIKHYQMDYDNACLLRDALLEHEDEILGLGESQYRYPEDQITGKMSYYNLFKVSKVWYDIGLPYIKQCIEDYLWLKEGEVVRIKCWGNILRLGNKIYPHAHLGVPDNYKDFPQSVSGNIFLGSNTKTATTYIIDGEQVDIENKFGQFTLFPPNLPHAVRAYEGEGVRLSAAFDSFSVTRDPALKGYRPDEVWYNYTVPRM